MAEKTEQPTQKKLSDGVKKGQILKSRDIVVSMVLLVGIFSLTSFFSFQFVSDSLNIIFSNNFEFDIHMFTNKLLGGAFKAIFSFIGLICVTVCITSLLQSKFKIATEIIKINIDAINPVNGFKRIFSLKTVKELIKTFLYMILLTFACILFWNKNKSLIFQTLDSELNNMAIIWINLFFDLVINCLSVLVVVMILDILAEYFLFMKDMKMDKEEVKREYKEQEGNPELKSRRKQMHQELLSEQLKSDIDNSKLIIANPTHIAIGIYFKPELSPIPLISVKETEQVALAVRKYAEKQGITVIRDIKLARRLFETHNRYDYVCLEELDKILDLIFWLEQVESAYQCDLVDGEEQREFNDDSVNATSDGGLEASKDMSDT